MNKVDKNLIRAFFVFITCSLSYGISLGEKMNHSMNDMSISMAAVIKDIASSKDKFSATDIRLDMLEGNQKNIVTQINELIRSVDFLDKIKQEK